MLHTRVRARRAIEASFAFSSLFLTCVSVARTCNLILIVLDVLKPLGHKKLIEHELEGFGIRLNKKPPNIGFKKKDKGGINFTSTVRHTVTHSLTLTDRVTQAAIHRTQNVTTKWRCIVSRFFSSFSHQLILKN